MLRILLVDVKFLVVSVVAFTECACTAWLDESKMFMMSGTFAVGSIHSQSRQVAYAMVLRNRDWSSLFWWLQACKC